MLEIKIPKEIRAYKGKLLLGLTVRQVSSLAAMVVVGAILGFYGGQYIPADILGWVVILIVVPIGGWGFLTYKGMNFEMFMKSLFSFYFVPKIRVYEDTDGNYFSFLNTELVAENIHQQRIDSGEIDEDDDETENY